MYTNKKMDGMTKGKIAEKIVESLFKDAGFKVIKYGYEYTVPQLADRNNLIKGEAAEFIRHQPDFIVVNEYNEAFFIEVKYRREGKIKKTHMFPYPCGYVVFITKDEIYAQGIEDIYRKGENFKKFKDTKPFSNIPQSIIDKYVRLTRRKLGDETFGGQFVEGLITKVTGKSLNPIKETTKVTIDGGGVDLYGWERVHEIPDWVLKKVRSRKAKKLRKDVWLVRGEHYMYKVVYENKAPFCYRTKKT